MYVAIVGLITATLALAVRPRPPGGVGGLSASGADGGLPRGCEPATPAGIRGEACGPGPSHLKFALSTVRGETVNRQDAKAPRRLGIGLTCTPSVRHES